MYTAYLLTVKKQEPIPVDFEGRNQKEEGRNQNAQRKPSRRACKLRTQTAPLSHPYKATQLIAVKLIFSRINCSKINTMKYLGHIMNIY